MIAPPTPRWHPIRWHERQQALWATPYRFCNVAAGRGSGKTELLKRRLVRWLPVKKPWARPMYFFAAPTRDQAERIAWEDIKALTPPNWIDSISETDLCLRTVFGSELWVTGLDKPQRIEGNQWDGGGGDEASDIKPGARQKSIMPALTHKRGWLWWQGVPKRQGIGSPEFRELCDKAERGELKDTGYYTWESRTILTPDQLDVVRANMDPKDYQEQFEAKWVNAGGSMFHSFSEAENVRPCAYDPTRQIIVGSDFNVDPMAWVLCHEVSGNLQVFGEVWERDANTAGTLAKLATRFQGHTGGWVFHGDASGQARRTSATESDYDLIRNHAFFAKAGRTVNYPAANPGVENRIASTNALLCNAAGIRRLFIDPKCKNLIADLGSRHYKKGTREAEDTGDLGHITDALGYVVHWRFPLRPFEGTGMARFGIGVNS